MFFSCFIILILIIYFFYLLIKYSGMEKPEYNLQYFRDKESIEYPTMVVGYLASKTIKEEHFIATVLDFVCKGFIKVERLEDNSDYIFTIIRRIKATDIEAKALKIFFNKQFLDVGINQSLNQFKKIMKNEKRFGIYGKIKRKFNTQIREFFDKKEEVKKITEGTNIMLCYVLFFLTSYSLIAKVEMSTIIADFMLSSFVFSLFLVMIIFIKNTLLGTYSYAISIIAIVVFLNIVFFIYYESIVLILITLILMGGIILFDDMLQRKKTNIANEYEKIKGLKKYIIEYSNIKEYDISNIYLWDQYYVYAVALNIKKI